MVFISQKPFTKDELYNIDIVFDNILQDDFEKVIKERENDPFLKTVPVPSFFSFETNEKFFPSTDKFKILECTFPKIGSHVLFKIQGNLSVANVQNIELFGVQIVDSKKGIEGQESE